MDLEYAKEAFEKFVLKYDLDNNKKPLKGKYIHTYKVIELMNELALSLKLSQEETDLAVLIALLHDIGRFPQYEKYKTFRDKNSVDHANLSVDYLFRDNHIRDFIKDDKYDPVIKNAILNHNKLELIKETDDLFAKMIRDVDKIDIFRVYSVREDSLVFDVNQITTEVLDSFKIEEPIKYDLIKTKTDVTILTLGFVFDFYFNESFEILVKSNNFEMFLESIEVKKGSEELFDQIKEICITKIKKGVV